MYREVCLLEFIDGWVFKPFQDAGEHTKRYMVQAVPISDGNALPLITSLAAI